jgi:hypothetical protein
MIDRLRAVSQCKEHTQVTHIRKAIAGLLLVIALVFPTGAFAASSTSSTAESLSVASTVSMTAPATATYAANDDIGPNYFYGLNVTVIGSNNPTGVTTSATVDPWVGPGGITIPTTKRLTIINAIDSGVPASGAPLTPVVGTLPVGSFANAGDSHALAASTGPLANADFHTEFYVARSEFSVGGDYTSAVHWSTSTNP